MQKTILITGATDGIGLVTARKLAEQGHSLLVHGRSAAKLDAVVQELTALAGAGTIESYLADLSKLDEVERMANAVTAAHDQLDVLINNAGILKTAHPQTADGLDIRFVVNTIAPYLLTKRLLPIMGSTSRVVNLSSAAQAPVNLDALRGNITLGDDMSAYAQSKLAITMWTRQIAEANPNGPIIVAVNPGSLLASKMVKEGFGIAGNDINIGANILIRAALSDEFNEASGQYFDNDAGRFAPPHADGLDDAKTVAVVKEVEGLVSKLLG